VLKMEEDPLVKRVGMVKNAKRDMSVAGQALWTEVLHHYHR
jgi:LysR family carnitine catabolism transcriptional activator